MKKQAMVGPLSLTLLMLSSMSQAAEWSLTADFNQKTSYDSNFLMKDTSLSTWSYLFKPSVEVAYKTPITESALSIDASVNRFDNFGEYNGEDIRLDWLNKYEGERLTWELSLGYSDTATRDVAITDTGDFDSNESVETKIVEPSIAWAVNERDNLKLSYAFSERTYTSEQFNANESGALSLEWARSVSEKLTALLSLSQVQYDVETSSLSNIETDFKTYNVGLAYLLSKSLTLDASIGYFTSEVDSSDSFTDLEGRPSNSEGGLVDINLTLKGQRNNVSLGLSANLTPTSLGEVSETNTLNIDWDYSLSPKSKLGASASWRDTQSTELADRKNTNVSFFYQYNMYQNFDIKLEWAYRGQDADALDQLLPLNLDVKSNQTSISFNYSI